MSKGLLSRNVILAEIAGMAPRLRSLRDLAMLQCFIDESGYPDKPIFVMAGWLASVDAWADFAVEWQECLDMKPPIKAFKMSDALSSWGDQTQDRVTRLHRIIDNHAIGGVSIALPIAPYEKYFSSIPDWKNPYLFALFQLIKGYRQHCDKIGVTRDLKFIFDEQDCAMKPIAEAWDFLKEKGNEYLLDVIGGTPSFEDDKKFLPLQAADLAAGWIRRQLEDQYNGISPLKAPWSIKDTVPHIAIRYDEDGLRRDYITMFEKPEFQQLFFRLGVWP